MIIIIYIWQFFVARRREHRVTDERTTYRQCSSGSSRKARDLANKTAVAAALCRFQLYCRAMRNTLYPSYSRLQRPRQTVNLMIQ